MNVCECAAFNRRVRLFARSVVSPLVCCVVRYAGVDAQRRVLRVDRGSPLHRYWDERQRQSL